MIEAIAIEAMPQSSIEWRNDPITRSSINHHSSIVIRQWTRVTFQRDFAMLVRDALPRPGEPGIFYVGIDSGNRQRHQRAEYAAELGADDEHADHREIR